MDSNEHHDTAEPVMPTSNSPSSLKKYEYLFTICTPVVNGVNDLPKLKQNIRQQNCNDLEWLIIDDGSQDGTRPLVESWLESGANEDGDTFSIRYKYQKNGGRHRAINAGVKASKGRFIIILDQSNECASHALKRLLEYWNEIPEEQRPFFAGVAGLSQSADGKIIGDYFPSNPFDSNSIETFVQHGVSCQSWGFYRRAVLEQFPYPVFQGEHYVPEELVLHRMGSRFLTRYVNEPVHTISSIDSSIEQTARQNKPQLLQKNPQGAALFFNELAAQRVPQAHRIRGCANYVRYSMHAGVIPNDIVKNASKRTFVFFLLWPGLFLYRRDIKKARKMI